MININGKAYHGKNVTVNNGTVKIDGKVIAEASHPGHVLEVHVTGDPANITADGSVTCESVFGDIHAGGSVTCDDVTGNVSAGGSVTCDNVGGNVHAGGSVTHG